MSGNFLGVVDPIFPLIGEGDPPRLCLELARLRELRVRCQCSTNAVHIGFRPSRLPAAAPLPGIRVGFFLAHPRVKRVRKRKLSSGSAGVQIRIKTYRKVLKRVRTLL